MNNLENKEILSDEILSAIDKILVHVPEIVFGGSVALSAVGLLNRKINDIDLFVDKFGGVTRKLGELLTSINADLGSDTVTDVNGAKVERLSFKIGNVKICVFRVDKEVLQYTTFEFARRKINIQNCNYAVAAKIAYSKKRDENNRPFNSTTKHIEDVSHMFKILDNEFPF